MGLVYLHLVDFYGKCGQIEQSHRWWSWYCTIRKSIFGRMVSLLQIFWLCLWVHESRSKVKESRKSVRGFVSWFTKKNKYHTPIGSMYGILTYINGWFLGFSCSLDIPYCTWILSSYIGPFPTKVVGRFRAQIIFEAWGLVTSEQRSPLVSHKIHSDASIRLWGFFVVFLNSWVMSWLNLKLKSTEISSCLFIISLSAIFVPYHHQMVQLCNSTCIVVRAFIPMGVAPARQ